ncbi:toprim domain-containing protein [Streptomyces sp. NPDC020379]|uniref:toprim domain-containing protein n=1 Tax=Streptomyces sp. NPDC020379 TaxID=3365071 RepID=UPI0037876A32
MWRLSESQKSDLVTAAKSYSRSYPGSPSEGYMVHRGLGEVADRFKIGFASDPVTGHEQYRGRLAIPYLRPAGGINSVTTIRFRCISDRCVKTPDGTYLEPHEETHDGHPKYLGLPGHPPRIYNTWALVEPSPHVVLAEGEFDAMASVAADVPATSVPGVSSWQPHFAPPFAGFTTVFSLGDGDKAGRQFNVKTCERLSNAIPIDLGDGYDVNRFTKTHGHEAYRERLGL